MARARDEECEKIPVKHTDACYWQLGFQCVCVCVWWTDLQHQPSSSTSHRKAKVKPQRI